MKFKEWWKCYKHDYVVLRTFKDSDIDGYVYEMTEQLIPKSELPTDARHCRGEPHYYSVDYTYRREFDRFPNGATANDLYRHMHSDVFYNLLSALFKKGDHIDVKKFLIIGGIIVAVVIGFYVFKGGM